MDFRTGKDNETVSQPVVQPYQQIGLFCGIWLAVFFDFYLVYFQNFYKAPAKRVIRPDTDAANISKGKFICSPVHRM